MRNAKLRLTNEGPEPTAQSRLRGTMARGYIHKRGARSWQIVYDVPQGSDGKRRQRFETVQGNKRQAEARLAEVL